MIAFLLPEGDEFDALQQQLDETGRCSIQPILSEEAAAEVEGFLAASEEWCRIRGIGNQRFDLPPERERDPTPQVLEDHRAIDQAIASDSSKSFAFLYDAIPMTEAALTPAPDGLLAQLRRAMTDPAVFRWLERLTGEPALTGVEIQATRFTTGDFLSLHHDGPNVDRKIATVLGLSRDWSLDWGGNLLFPSVDDRLEGLSPGYNRLDLFMVPQFHSVTAVSPAALRPRLAVSGWFLG
ncbi:2OG-Fe(II) oxygenase family protein [Parerythrobacter lacustris]|uniref:2OG-Fe(II) oxygenase n=1 Tax=Parerythrobacter lacustris TaxID=2969984 RepID=A0ABT1XV54_9SPHN|nr:2OG-Fe(II) oxygenase family protein [Parerythrobacter lacustris]MCR2834525.1 2OG-Fe(II) oxygenase [Parerythrobacter lacustris]